MNITKPINALWLDKAGNRAGPSRQNLGLLGRRQ
jgi:hypothetical protein